VNQSRATTRGVQIALPVGIMLGGIALASAFRRPVAPEALPLSGNREAISFRQPVSPIPGKVILQTLPERVDQPYVETTVERLSPSSPSSLPGMPRSYPGPEWPRSESLENGSASMPASTPADSEPAETRPTRKRFSRPAQKHRIADGDTLSKIAQQYLGDAGRAPAIFEANRGTLSSPDILPIGAELVIPPE
jgi:hypothetical protein